MRGPLSTLLIFLGSVTLFAGVIGSNANRSLFDHEGFADAAIGALDADGARQEIANLIVDELERQGTSRAEAEPVVSQSVATIAENQAFRGALSQALILVNRAVLEGDLDGVEVVAENVGGPIRDGIAERDPALAGQISEDLDLPIANTSSASTIVDLARVADGATGVASALPFVGGLMMLLGVALARNRRIALFFCGVGIGLGGVAIAVIYFAGRAIASGQPADESAGDAAGAIWAAVFENLLTSGLVMVIAGFVFSIIAVAIRGRGRATA